MTQYLSSLASPGGNLTQQGVLPRASYALTTYVSDSVALYGSHFLDSEFRKISAGLSQAGYGNVSGYEDATPGAYSSFGPGVTLNRLPSSNAGLMINGHTGVSEFGNDGIVTSERGLHMPVGTRLGTYGLLATRNTQAFVNSDHTDKTKVLMFASGVFTVAPLFRPRSRVVNSQGDYDSQRKEKSVAVAVTGGQVTSMLGSASYNNVRKELILLVNNTTVTGQYDVYIWKNFDLDANGMDISLLPNAPTLTFSVSIAAFSTMTVAGGYTTETMYNPKPVLCDNGDIIFAAMHPASALRLYRIVRTTGDASASVTTMVSQGTSTTYGMENSQGYGAKAMQSRDGRLVAVYAPYYYYNTGLVSYFIDRRAANYIPVSNQATDVAFSIVKYRDDSLAYMLSGAVYSYQAQPVLPIYTVSPRPSLAPYTSVNYIAPPTYYATNNSSYPSVPVLSHVWEYNLQGLASV